MQNLGLLSHFECLACASENFTTSLNDCKLLRTSRGRIYLLMKKIPSVPLSRIKRHHICRQYPLKHYTTKIWPKLQNPHRIKVLTGFFSVARNLFISLKEMITYKLLNANLSNQTSPWDIKGLIGGKASRNRSQMC